MDAFIQANTFEITNDLKTVHTVCTLLCLGFECYTHFFRIPSLALGQSCDCPSANEATLKKVGKLSQESQGTNDTASLPGNNVHKTVDFFMGYTIFYVIIQRSCFTSILDGVIVIVYDFVAILD